ncbi:acyl-CoA-binding domain-containing protein 1-like isoform X2 [Papaver somniferum]|uniref:acyl-CoA-binding domain-containing protein 1-like isoform X2 n=1 Tax=Papaver somniferum TaxID=3469 RepID=UPI000E6FF84D|nr:acyl-CoA-binding domain-containing protein 1-like isoform X2 [Papaver somniferum]
MMMMINIMGGDWQEITQSIIIGLIFSFLVAKLISMVISIKDANLKVTREQEEEDDDDNTKPNQESTSLPEVKEEEEIVESDEKKKSAATTRVVSESDEDGDDDWEGVESTELDEIFSAATAFVATAAADRLSQKVSNDVQLQLYGLYKIATEGPCTSSQPSAIKLTARAKWNAWQKLGAMPPEDAMEKYITIVSEIYPAWISGSSVKHGGDNDGNDSKGPMGPVFSSFAYEEESENELKMEAIHTSAREGELDNLVKHIESGISVNLKDSEGRSPLHWAVDRGHLDMVELLLSKNADVNAQDNEGQTPLHYAAMCDREAIAEVLVKQNADTDVKDNDGSSASDLCESNWSWLRK